MAKTKAPAKKRNQPARSARSAGKPDANARAKRSRKADHDKSKRTAAWITDESAPVPAALARYSKQCLRAYREDPRLVVEHANMERAAAEGGYGRRQLFELIQNGADELVGQRGRIEVVLTETALYCANEGKPITEEGVGAILAAHVSPKKGVEIGRFGLGFKSVLGVTTQPQFFSRSGSFAFDPQWAAGEIKKVVPDADRAPTLRLARAVEPVQEAREDPVLRELMDWATTVVRLPLDKESDWLTAHFREFPSQFLVFSPHVERLVLDDRREKDRRVIELQEADGGVEELVESDSTERWFVFQKVHRPSTKADRDAGALQGREEIPVAWAVPLEGARSRGRGRFWAFFPTEYETTLSGVVNAPWKLNEDRRSLLEGPFNSELVEVAAGLVVDNMEQLVEAQDPGAVLDKLPARGREAPNWADEQITERVYELAKNSPSIPNQEGELELPMALDVHPEGTPQSALVLWSQAPGRPVDWCHASIEGRERRPRVDRLLQAKGNRPASLADWFEEITRSASVDSSVAAVSVAAAIVGERPDLAEEIKACAMVFTSDERLAPPDPGRVFLPGAYPVSSKLTLVHKQLARNKRARADLETLGIKTVDPGVELLTKLGEGNSDDWDAEDWELFWTLVRRTGSVRALPLLRESGFVGGAVEVRTRSGEWFSLGATLLPGPIARESDEADAGVVIDTAHHSEELSVLQALGAVQGPLSGGGSQDEPWFDEYRREQLEELLKTIHAAGARPSEDQFHFSESKFAGPVGALDRLSEPARARFTAELLLAEEEPRSWTLRHSTGDRYPTRNCPNPVIWAVRRFGRLETSLGIREPDDAVGPQLQGWDYFMPVARCTPEAAVATGLPTRLEELEDEDWRAAFERALEISDDEALGRLYSAAAEHVGAPDYIRCRIGQAHETEAVNAIAVTADRREFEVLIKSGRPVLLVSGPDQAAALVSHWGARAAGESVTTEVASTPSGPAEPLIDAFPLLRHRLREEQQQLMHVPCSELRIETFTEGGRISTETRFSSREGTVYWTDDLEPGDLLRQLSDALALNLSADDIERILKNKLENQVRQLRAAIKKEKSLERKLLRAVGAEALRAKLPGPLVDSLEGSVSDEELARLALAVYGVDALYEFRTNLEESGLEPPAQWAGSRAAVRFATGLGFPREYARFEGAKRPRLLEVEGPPKLGELHDFQHVIVDEIHKLLGGSPKGRRGLLSLPTGAGKTRVTVQALVEALAQGRLGSPILWVAQTDELNEQAVQAWNEIWRAFGPAGAQLTISRLWSSNDAEQVEQGDQVVVATIAKLNSGVFSDKGYDWLAKASCVVIDEAHGAITPQYTGLLDWQGMARGRDRAPLIGLTATPFRGTSEEETKRLVNRFGGRRLDLPAFGGGDAYEPLQEKGVLAKVEHKLLKGKEIELDEKQLRELRKMRRLPSSAEAAIGADKDRNVEIVESIVGHDDSWTVLLFAASVEHAQIVAALLAREGIAAAAISADTEPAARRHYVEEFRKGEVRVLTNYGVFTQGFDAPAVRAVYVTRPTFSPNLYQQMIGRGLRGPLNQGKETCLIVNVEDNVVNFGEELAFREFEYLWNGSSG
jgi:superfamily II DNA or RNA helicase